MSEKLNKNGETPETKKEKKESIFKKIGAGIKNVPEKHPRVAKAGKVTVAVGKAAIKAAFVAGAGTVAALTILDKTKGKSYASLPSIGDRPEIPTAKAADPDEVFKKAAESCGMEVKEL